MIDLDEAAERYLKELSIGPETDLAARLSKRRSRRRLVAVGAAAVVLLLAAGVVRWASPGGGTQADVLAVGSDDIALDELYADAPRAEQEEVTVPIPVAASLGDGWEIELAQVILSMVAGGGSTSIFRLSDGEHHATLNVSRRGWPIGEDAEVVDLPGLDVGDTTSIVRLDDLLGVRWDLGDDWTAELLPSDLDEAVLVELASSLVFEHGPLAGPAPDDDHLGAFYPGYDDRVLAAGVVDGQPWQLLANAEELALTLEFDGTLTGGTTEFDASSIPSIADAIDVHLLANAGSRLAVVMMGEVPASVAVVHPDGVRTEHPTITIADGDLVVAAVPIPADVAASSIEVTRRTGERATVVLPTAPSTGWATGNLGGVRYEPAR